eukprot:COSAG06_NODE_22802_length_712_cov_0.830343_1_plen_44_part_10
MACATQAANQARSLCENCPEVLQLQYSEGLCPVSRQGSGILMLV